MFGACRLLQIGIIPRRVGACVIALSLISSCKIGEGACGPVAEADVLTIHRLDEQTVVRACLNKNCFEGPEISPIADGGDTQVIQFGERPASSKGKPDDSALVTIEWVLADGTRQTYEHDMSPLPRKTAACRPGANFEVTLGAG